MSNVQSLPDKPTNYSRDYPRETPSSFAMHNKTRPLIQNFVLAAAFSAPLSIQAADASTNASDTVQLSPVEVTETSEGGYRATNTLGATRTDTPIADLPLIINTVTEEFMRDMAAFEVDQAIQYLGGVSISFNE